MSAYIFMEDVDRLVRTIAGESKIMKRLILTFLSNNHIDVVVPYADDDKENRDAVSKRA